MKRTKPETIRSPRNPAGDRVQSGLPRWAVLAICFLLAASATWGFFEFVVWNALPPELVGKWVVVEPQKQDGATFDFFRNGTLEAHLNNDGTEFVLKARVAVRDKILFTTTQNPSTGRDETRKSIIRELTKDSLIVEFEKSESWKMMRAP